MFQRPWLLPLLFLALTFSSQAQQFDASAILGSTPLDAPWRLHFGDDPACSQPGFDDSHWTLHRIDKDWAGEDHKGYAGYAWYRMRVILPRSSEPLAIAIYPPANAVEVYIDGTLAGTIGRMRPEPVFTRRRTSYAIPVPAALNGRSVEVALRAWVSPQSAPYLGAGAAAHPSLLGTASDIGRIVSLDQQKRWLDEIPQWAVDLLGFAVGLFSFGLFVLQRQAREYAYAALYLCGDAALSQYSWITSQLGYSVALTAGVHFIVSSFLLCFWLLFTWGFVRARADRLLYACLAATWINAIGTTPVTLGVISVASFYWCLAAMYLFLSIVVFVRLYPLARHGNRDAQLFLIPFFLTLVADGVLRVVGALDTSGVVGLQSHLILYRNPHFSVSWQQFFQVLSYVAIGAVLVLRFARSARQEQRLSTEMESARRVQGQLVPTDLPATGRFRFEAAYQAANEVGGDLYQVYPRADGSVMILVGDVSGKGLKAAMLGTLLVGAANALAKENLTPAQMLSRLNQSLYGNTDGGFATCLCCLVAPNGTLNISNAGHLAPYRNGEEMPCAPGLPLGLVAAVEYDGMEIQLGECDTLTFMSDGVVEARNAQGELFGFARAQAISAEPARKIAEQAIGFGQEDDITVLRLMLQPTRVSA